MRVTQFRFFCCAKYYFAQQKKSKICDSHYFLTSRGCKIGRERYSFPEGTMSQDLRAAEHPTGRDLFTSTPVALRSTVYGKVGQAPFTRLEGVCRNNVETITPDT